MLHVQQPALLRMMRAGIASAAILLGLPVAALAQTAASPCFELIPARPRIEPPAPMLVDKCSGRTWLLARPPRGGAFRWIAINADEAEKPKATDRPATDTQPANKADKDGDGKKCFTFNNRKFCE